MGTLTFAARIRQCQLQALSLTSAGGCSSDGTRQPNPTAPAAPGCPDQRGFRCSLTRGPCLPCWPAGQGPLPSPPHGGSSISREDRTPPAARAPVPHRTPITSLRREADILRHLLDRLQARIAELENRTP